MTTRARIRGAAAEIAARLEIDARELKRLFAVARAAGWTSRPDQLAAVLLAYHAEHFGRGRHAEDPVVAAIWREGPRRQNFVLQRARAAAARAEGGWQRQYRRRRSGGKRAGAGRKPRAAVTTGGAA